MNFFNGQIIFLNNFIFHKFKQIHEKFIDQEKKKEWKRFKTAIVKNIIDKYGIIPGKGKYITNTNSIEETKKGGDHHK